MTVSQITGSSGGIIMSKLKYANPITVTATGTISGTWAGIVAAFAWTVDNYGSISATTGNGVFLHAANSALTNAAGATIQALRTGVILGSTSALYNAGNITGTLAYGVLAQQGGSVTNAATGVVKGAAAGVQMAGPGSVDNLGIIQAIGGSGVLLGQGGYVTNTAGGTITGASELTCYGVAIGGHVGTVTNAGLIGGASFGGVALRKGGLVDNEAGGTISGAYAIIVNGPGSVTNAGSILSRRGTGIVLNAGGTVSSAASGIITGYAGIQIRGGAGAVDNAGTISAGVSNGIGMTKGGSVINRSSAVLSGRTGIYINFGQGTVDNAGSITGNYGISLVSGGSVTNEATGQIVARTGIVISHGATVDNAGLIAGTKNDSIYFLGGGTVINETSGRIENAVGVQIIGGAGTVSNSGGIKGITFTGLYMGHGGTVANAKTGKIAGASGIIAAGAATTVTNSGQITGATGVGLAIQTGGSLSNAAGGVISGVSKGVYGWIAATSVTNAGSITASSGSGVTLLGGGSVSNASTGTINGGNFGVYLKGGPTSILENAGTISGGKAAVELTASISNRLIVDGGAVFTGNVIAKANAANTLELTNKSGTGTISGLGTKLTGFHTITIDAGASWAIDGNLAGFKGVTINGFTNSDLIDLTDLGFAPGETVSLDQTTNILTIADSHGATLAALQVVGNLGGHILQVGSDGSGGTAVGVTETQISGSTGGVILNPIAYSNPIVVTATGSIYSGGNGLSAATPWTVTNYGSISAANDGVALQAGGTLNNGAPGSVGGAFGVVIAGGPGAVNNAGHITAAGGDGVELLGGGSVANGASASMVGSVYGVEINGGAGTVENAGTIGGATYAVKFDAKAANRLIVDAGGVFQGGVVANPLGTNTIELTATNGAGALNGLGSQYLGFQNILIDSDVSWTVAGKLGGFKGTTIAGFTVGDILDVTDLSYAAGETVQLARNNTIVISNAARTVIATIQLASSDHFDNATVSVSDDGKGGTRVAIADPEAGTSLQSLTKSGWNFAGNWNPQKVPNSATVDVTIALNSPSPYQLNIFKNESFLIHGLTINATKAQLVLFGALTSTGSASLLAGSIAMAGGSLTGALSIAAGAALTGYGTVTGAVANSGLIDAQSVALGTKLSIRGDVTGTGTLQIEQLRTLELGGNAAGQTISFVNGKFPRGTLILDQPGGSFGTITGFQISDTIDLKGVAATSDQYANGILTVFNGADTVASLAISGDFTGQKFTVSNDGSGGTIIGLAKSSRSSPALLNDPQVNAFAEAVATHGNMATAFSDVSLQHRSFEAALSMVAPSFHH